MSPAPPPRSAARTTGMLVLGITHIALGALGTLASCGFLVAALAMLVPAHLGITHGPLAFAVGDHRIAIAVGIILLGVTHAFASVVLIVAGVRVFDVARSARTLSMLAAFLWTFANVIEFFAFNEPLWWFLVFNAYPAIVELLFLRKDWKAAFAGEDILDALPSPVLPRASTPPAPPVGAAEKE